MTSMPTIDDHMVVELRRTGRRRASYAKGRSTSFIDNGSHVVLQQVVGLDCGHRGIRDCVVSCGPGRVCVGGFCVAKSDPRYVEACG
jgi:hypothetical protein